MEQRTAGQSGDFLALRVLLPISLGLPPPVVAECLGYLEKLGDSEGRDVRTMFAKALLFHDHLISPTQSYDGSLIMCVLLRGLILTDSK